LFCKTHTRIADDRFRAPRWLSISDIIDATERPRRAAISRRVSINSASSEMLVWCPDKDTDIFFIWLL